LAVTRKLNSGCSPGRQTWREIDRERERYTKEFRCKKFKNVTN
jgi:hypothetical protein